MIARLVELAGRTVAWLTLAMTLLTFGVVVLGEQLSVSFVLGGVLVVGGVLAATTERVGGPARGGVVAAVPACQQPAGEGVRQQRPPDGRAGPGRARETGRMDPCSPRCTSTRSR